MRWSIVASAVVTATAIVSATGSSSLFAADIPTKAAGPAYSAFAPNTGWYAYVGTSAPLTRPTNSLKEDGCTFICGGESKLGADNAWGAISGIGYRFNPYFRMDFRLGYGWAAVSGTTNRRAPAPGAPDVGQTTGDVSGWGSGLNFYLDLKPFWGAWLGNFEPYIGAGVGYARVTFSNMVFNSQTGGSTTWPNVTDSAFGYTLTAGTAYRLNRNWLFDVAYIWRDFGKFASGAISPTNKVQPASNFSGDLSGHAIDVGFRYEF